MQEPQLTLRQTWMLAGVYVILAPITVPVYGAMLAAGAVRKLVRRV
jgi:hypothetical protein